MLKALAIAVSLAFSMPAVAQSSKGDSSAQSGGSANQSASSGGSSGQSASTGQTTSLNQDSARSDDRDWGWIGLLGLLGLAGLKRRRDHDRHLDSTTTRTTAR